MFFNMKGRHVAVPHPLALMPAHYDAAIQPCTNGSSKKWIKGKRNWVWRTEGVFSRPRQAMRQPEMCRPVEGALRDRLPEEQLPTPKEERIIALNAETTAFPGLPSGSMGRPRSLLPLPSGESY